MKKLDLKSIVKEVAKKTIKEYGLEHDPQKVGDEDFDHPSIKKGHKKEVKEGLESIDVDRFEEIMDEIKELAREALMIAKDGKEGERAKAYWYAHIVGAVDKENSGYMGGSMIDMAATLEALRENEESEDDEIDDNFDEDEDMDDETRNDRPDSLKENKESKSYQVNFSLGVGLEYGDSDGQSDSKTKVLSPNETYTLIIDYPLNKAYKKSFKSNSNGTTLGDLVNFISKKYEEVYNNEEKYGVWGHDIDQLIIETINIDGDKITLGMGS